MFKMSRFQAFAASTVILATPQLAIAETRDYDLTGFNNIEISTGIKATIEVGDVFSIQAKSDDAKALDALEIKVRGGMLSAELDRGFFAFLKGQSEDVNIHITLPELREIESKAGANVVVSGSYGDTFIAEASSGASLSIEDLLAANVTLEASSGAHLQVSGSCSSLHASASSGGTVQAETYTCANVITKASSGATASVVATEAITASASSGASIKVTGNPEDTEINESSGGNVSIRN